MYLTATHRTRYVYPTTATDSHNEVRLMPSTGPTQRCIGFSLQVAPSTPIYSYEDVGGTVHHFGILEPHRSLEIVAIAQVETFDINPFRGLDLISSDIESYRLDPHANEAEFLSPSPYVRLDAHVDAFAPPLPKEGNAARYLLDLTGFLYETLQYDPAATDVHTMIDEVLEQRAGVCQDFAHLMAACCRMRGIPARYVSGYLYGGEGLRGEIGTHAWVDCLLPDGRWVAFDPTNNLLANDHYIRVHVGRDYSDVSPTRGVYVGAPASKMDFGVTVVETTAAALRQ